MKEYFSPSEFVSKTGLGRATVYRKIKAGKIPSIRIDGRILISAAWLSRQTKEQEDEKSKRDDRD